MGPRAEAPDAVVEAGRAHRPETWSGLAKKRCPMAWKRVTREWTLHRLAVDDLKLMEPRVDPRLMAKAMKAEAVILILMKGTCPTEGPNSRLALERVKAELKASPLRAERREAVPVCRQKANLERTSVRATSR